MANATALLLILGFLVGIGALIALIWASSRGQVHGGPSAARVIFDPGEEGSVEDPSATELRRLQAAAGAPGLCCGQTEEDLAARREADLSSRVPVLLFLGSAALWLVTGSVLGLIVSLKFNFPDWLSSSPLVTFGRLRPLHLNIIAYGWLSMAGLGVSLWLIPRLLRTPLVGKGFAVVGALLWDLGVAVGSVALLFGITDGLEWLEFPWFADVLLVTAGGLTAMPLLLTLKNKRVEHLYVSTWYIAAALVWFPILFLVANASELFSEGVPQATVNWWFAHNALGLWFTPMALAASYYLIPKVLGRPIHSYQLSLLGFWALALFYSHVGIHHLIGGPVPTWLVTVSVVTSMMMIVPVVAVAINQHLTVMGRLRAVVWSPTLRFVVLGAMTYTLVSVQGSLQSLRSVNTVLHFTHATVAHAHLGAYGFASFIFFGAMYFILPRVTRWEWPYPKLIALHFWLVVVGFGVYFVFLTLGGVLQGLAMLDASRPFMESVEVTLPYLHARSLGGTLMALGHIVFAVHALLIVLRRGPARSSAALFVPVS